MRFPSICGSDNVEVYCKINNSMRNNTYLCIHNFGTKKPRFRFPTNKMTLTLAYNKGNLYQWKQFVILRVRSR